VVYLAPPCIRPKGMEPTELGLKHLKSWAQINLSSLKLFSKVFCHNNEKFLTKNIDTKNATTATAKPDNVP
jgi:hypothetical protein